MTTPDMPVQRPAEAPQPLPMTVEEFARRVAAIESAVGERIVGQHDMVRQTVLGLLNEGHVLLEGVPGLGKTEMLKALADAIDLSFSRLQFTPDLMPADIVGTQVLAEDDEGHRRFRFQEGPIFANLVLADEINRATPKSQSALLEAMQERTATVAGITHNLPRPFLVMATQNPIELEGTYPLPEAQLDRFMIKINVKPPDQALLSAILTRSTAEQPRPVPTVVSGEELQAMIDLAKMVPVASHLVNYIAELVTNTHPSTGAIGAVTKYVRHGASPRGGQAIMKLARTMALVDGRPNASRDDIAWSVLPALGHRLVLNYEATADRVTVEDVLSEVLAGTPEPGPQMRGVTE